MHQLQRNFFIKRVAGWIHIFRKRNINDPLPFGLNTQDLQAPVRTELKQIPFIFINYQYFLPMGQIYILSLRGLLYHLLNQITSLFTDH